MRNVLIQYIGKQPRRVDDVRPGSGRVWEHQLAVVEVPEAEKGYYLAHKAEWREVTLKQLESTEAENREALAQALPIIDRMSLLALYQLADAVGQAIGAKEAERRIEIAAAVAASKPPKVEEQPAMTTEQAKAASPGNFQFNVRRVAVALSDMDQSDSQQYNLDTGMPLPEAIRDQCGIYPTDAEIIEAMALAKIEPKIRQPIDMPVPPEEPEPTEDAPLEPLSEPVRANIALSNLDQSPLEEMLDIASTFGIPIPKRPNRANLYPILQEGLQKIAAAQG